MNTLNSIPLRGDRYIDKKTAYFMLDTGVKPHKLPICHHEASSHASGCSVAAFVARAMRSNLNFLRNQIDICLGEVMHERDFGIMKLQEHIDILGSLNLLQFSITADRISGFDNVLESEVGETENILAQAFAKLPQEDLKTYNEGIIKLRGILEDDILLQMMELRDKILGGQRRYPEEDIQFLMYMEVGPKLAKIYDELVELNDAVGSIVEKIRDDFKADLNQLESDGHG